MVYFCFMLTKAERTRQFIVEQAAPIFNTKGYAATSMSDILRATGLAKGGIYGNFSSKDEIAIAAFNYSYGKLIDALRGFIGEEQTASGKLLAILKFYRNYTLKPGIEGGCPVLNTAVDADDSLPFLKERAASALREMLRSLENIIGKGIESGEFATRLDIQKEALMIYGQIEGGIMMSKLTDDPELLNNLLDILKEQITTRYIQ